MSKRVVRRSSRKGKTGYRRKFTSMMSHKRGRCYTKSRRRTRVSVKRRSRGKSVGGYLDKSNTFVSGHATRLTNAFRAKCLRAVSPVLVQCFENFSVGSCSQSTCGYLYPSGTFVQDQVFSLANRTFGSTPNSSTRFGVHSCDAVYKLVNPNNVATNCRVYYCEPRHDIPYYYQNTPSTPVVNNLAEIVAQGWVDMNNAAIGSDVAGTLFMNQDFVSRFNILNCEMLKLSAGETRTLNIKQPSTRYLNYSRWVNAGSPQIYMAQGWSKFIIIQYWGMPVQEVSNTSILGLAASFIQVASTIRYTVSACAPEEAEVFNTQVPLDGSGQSFALATTGSTQVVVEQTGVVAPVV